MVLWRIGRLIPLTPEQQNEEDRRAGRWVDALAEWERASNSRWRKGGVWGSHEEANHVPPGVRSVVPVVLGRDRKNNQDGKDGKGEGKGMGKRDYWLRRPENALRPEVCCNHPPTLGTLGYLLCIIGHRKLVHPLENNRRRKVAGQGMANM